MLIFYKIFMFRRVLCMMIRKVRRFYLRRYQGEVILAIPTIPINYHGDGGGARCHCVRH